MWTEDMKIRYEWSVSEYNSSNSVTEFLSKNTKMKQILFRRIFNSRLSVKFIISFNSDIDEKLMNHILNFCDQNKISTKARDENLIK